jgi:glyoxylase-like metal-dependent hydrolase (beta-lactamase superfamily II)
MLKELAPGIHAWTDKKVTGFRAFAVVTDDGVVLIDPLTPDAEEAKQLAALGSVKAVLVTGAWHERDAVAIAQQHGVTAYAHPDAIKHFEIPGVQPLPETLPGGIEAVSATGSFQGQVDYYVPRDGGSLLVGDSWHNIDMQAVPFPVRLFMKHVIKLRHGLHLTPPVKCQNPQQLVETYREVLKRPVERLLVSHGACLKENARHQMLARLEQGP